jgi:hypothetical protein
MAHKQDPRKSNGSGSRSVDAAARLEKELANIARRARKAGFPEASHFIQVAVASLFDRGR